jgi:hypothetical protein
MDEDFDVLAAQVRDAYATADQGALSELLTWRFEGWRIEAYASPSPAFSAVVSGTIRWIRVGVVVRYEDCWLSAHIWLDPGLVTLSVAALMGLEFHEDEESYLVRVDESFELGVVWLAPPPGSTCSAP